MVGCDTDGRLEVDRIRDVKSVELQHAHIILDRGAAESYIRVAQKLPKEPRNLISRAYLEDQSLRRDRKLKDGGALPQMLWKILLSNTLDRVGELAVQADTLGRRGVQVLLLHVADPLLHPGCTEGDPDLEKHVLVHVLVHPGSRSRYAAGGHCWNRGECEIAERQREREMRDRDSSGCNTMKII